MTLRMQLTEARWVDAGATFDETGEYRYSLWRAWGEGPTVCWVMLNPSTADAEQEDPTIRRCIGFARHWGFGAVAIVNLFALRSTDPRHLYPHRRGGWVYQVVPQGIIEPDPDCNTPGLSWECERARIVRVWKLSGFALSKVRRAAGRGELA